MRTVIVVALALAACSPAAAPSDGGPPLVPGIVACPASCVVTCDATGHASCWVTAAPGECFGCRSLCVAPLAIGDAPVSLDTPACGGGAWECPLATTDTPPLGGRCFRDADLAP